MVNIGDVSQWIATTVIAASLFITIRKNGRELRERDEKLAREQTIRETTISSELKNIKEAITSPESGLGVLLQEISSVKENCSGITAGFRERIKNLEKD